MKSERIIQYERINVKYYMNIFTKYTLVYSTQYYFIANHAITLL